MNAMEAIHESVAHRLTLKLWEKEELVLNRRIEQKESRCRNIQSEIYQFLGLYCVFQGVVLTALFQAVTVPNEKKCKCWWSPFVLTVIALVGTVGAVHHKFHLQMEIQYQVEEEKENSRALFRRIQQLRADGTRFDLNNPLGGGTHCAPTSQRPREWEWAYWWGYRGAVTLILIAFSAILLISCRRLLCSNS